jgi:putative nucleotidyltransferase with HDIG domain
MDTPADYESLKADIQRYTIPTPAECSAMLSDPLLFTENTAAHCRQVARIASFLGKALSDYGVPINLEKITAAAQLHDIAKGQKQHAAAGAEILRKIGFSGIADIVASHMDIKVPMSSCLTEAEVVYLSDKLAMGSDLVSLDVRFGHKLDKYGDAPVTRASILRRKTDAEAIVKRLEHALGRSFQSLMDSFPGDRNDGFLPSPTR